MTDHPRESTSVHRHSSGKARRNVGWRSRDIVRATTLVLGVIFATRLFWVAHALFFVVFLGMLFGIAVSGGVNYLQRFKIPRSVGATSIVLGFLAILIGFGAWVAPTLREQGGELKQKLPEAVERAQEWAKRNQGGLLGLVMPQADEPASTPAGPAKAGAATDSVPATKGSDLHGKIREKMSGMSQYLFPFIASTVEIVGGLLLILFLTIYFAADPDLYRRGLLSLLPAKKRPRGTIMMDRIAVVLRKWLLTQLIAMAVVGAVTTLVLLIMGVKAAFALGVLAGLFEFIPTIGPILSALPGMAMGFLDSPEKAGYIGLAYWAIQFLESHVLVPLLMKEGLKLPPALTVVTQAMLAIVFGFIGLMVAVPLLATVMVVFQMFYLEQLPAEGTWTYPVQGSDDRASGAFGPI
jgi:predicted PurR-regulated permease PerM